MTVYQIERRGKGRALLHFAMGSEWIHRDGRKWVMDSQYYGHWTGDRLPREGESLRGNA